MSMSKDMVEREERRIALEKQRDEIIANASPATKKKLKRIQRRRRLK